MTARSRLAGTFSPSTNEAYPLAEGGVRVVPGTVVLSGSFAEAQEQAVIATTQAAAALASANAAATSASGASTSATSAGTSATNANTSKVAAAASAAAALVSQNAAAGSATAAAGSATTAATSASGASTSATNAATSATNAANSATAAATSASNALTQAGNASTSASGASTSASGASTSAAAAAASLVTFRDGYYGTAAADPTVRPSGAARVAGDIYYRTTAVTGVKVWDGAAWQPLATDTSTLMVKASNLSDVASVSTARTNLGLGGAALLAVGLVAGTVAAGDDTRITGAAQKSANLSDLANAATARANLGLGNVNNTTDANKPVSTAQQTALDLKANLASPTFTGVPAVPTAAANTNTTQAASTAFVLANRSGVDTVIGRGYAATASYITGASFFAFGDAIPTITEGGEILTLTYTPASANSRLRIESKIPLAGNANSYLCYALFQDAVTNAIDTDLIITSLDGTAPTYHVHEMLAGTTSPITFRIRVGCVSGNIWHVNGHSSGRRLGGMMKATLIITEFKG